MKTVIIAILTLLFASASMADQEVFQPVSISNNECSGMEMFIGSTAGAVIGYLGGSALSSARFGKKVVSAMPDHVYEDVKEVAGDIGNAWLTKPKGAGWKFLGKVEDLPGIDFSEAKKVSQRVGGTIGMLFGSTAGAVAGVVECQTQASDKLWDVANSTTVSVLNQIEEVRHWALD